MLKMRMNRRNDISLAMVIVDSDGSHDVQVGHSDC